LLAALGEDPVGPGDETEEMEENLTRKLIILTAAALLLAPAAMAADPGKGKAKSAEKAAAAQAAAPALPNGAQRCVALRTSLTPAVFASTYGANESDKNAFGKCVAQLNRANVSAKAGAASACRAEQGDANFAASHDGKTFAQHYGGSDDASKAFGKCVSQKAKAKVDASLRAKAKAVKACLAERRANAEAFKAEHKTFGRCVTAETPPS